MQRDRAVGELLDAPAAFVYEPVVVGAEWAAVDDAGLAAVEPVDDVVDDIDGAGAAGGTAAAAVLGVQGVTLARRPAGLLRPMSSTADGVASGGGS
jgi:hypothetical protein